MSETNATAAGPLEPVKNVGTPSKPRYAITEAAIVAYIGTLPEVEVVTTHTPRRVRREPWFVALTAPIRPARRAQ